MILKCEAFAIPPPIYRWLKNEKQIDFSRYKIKNNSLEIASLDLADTSNFTCKADNIYGSIENTFSLKVLG